MFEGYLDVTPRRTVHSSTAAKPISTAKVEEAIVLSRMPGDGQAILLTHHKIDESNDGIRRLGTGKPVEKQHVIDLLVRLTSDGIADFLPENVVCHSPAGIAWWAPARVHKMHWSLPGKVQTMTVPWPTLYFVAGFGASLRVFALESDKRPCPDTTLYHAPLGNIYEGGALCWGNINIPNQGVENIQGYEDAIYNTGYTHTNTPNNFKGADAEKENSLLKFWLELHKQKSKSFPVEKLLRNSNRTAGSVLKGL